MIYHLVNKRTEILGISTSHVVDLCNQFNHVFAQLVSMPRINFYQNRPKMKLFLQKKYKIFERRRLRPHTPVTGYDQNE